MHLALLVGLLGPLPTAPIGDGGSLLVEHANQSVHRVPVRLGVEGGGVEVTVEGYQAARFVVQCAGEVAELPPLTLTADDAEVGRLEPTPVAFPEGAPAVWISTRREGRAALDALLGDLDVVHLAPKQVPVHFAALRFAPVLLVEAADLGEISEAARQALRGAVAAGATLVLGVGEAEPAPDALTGWLDARLEPPTRPGPSLIAALARASRVRPLKPGPAARARLVADGHVVVVEQALGLGRVRAVGVALGELESGPLLDALLAGSGQALDQALAWLRGARPLAEGRGGPLGAHVWWMLLAVPLLGLLGRRAPRAAGAGGAILLAAALVVPPTPSGAARRADGARVLYVPFDGGALAVGTFDLTLARGGGLALPAGGDPVSLEEATPAGACAVLADAQAMWTLRGAPGSRRRLAYFALHEAAPEAFPGEQRLPAWPAGPLAEARLDEVTAESAPLPLDARPAEVRAWRLRAPAPPPADPIRLGGPQ